MCEMKAVVVIVVLLSSFVQHSHAFSPLTSITTHNSAGRSFVAQVDSHSLCLSDPSTYRESSHLRMSSTATTSADSKAKVTLAKQFILASSSLNALEDIEPFLGENVECIAAESVRTIGKQAYLSRVGKEVATLYRAMPDLQTSSYGYDVDENDPNTIWLKIRQRGTLTGVFSYDGDVYPGNNKAVEFPVEVWSITVQGSKISRITKGYVIDRTTGNTKGLTGIKGTLVALGEAPSVASYLPLPVALKRFFGRNRKSPAKSSSSSPFPFPVMKSLAEQIVSTEFGLKSPELLTNDFLYSSPFDGPLTKREFLATKGSLTDYIADSDIPLKFSNAHLDPFEPDRVWLTFYPKSNREEYEGAPEVIGVSINVDGLCYKVTAGYIADRTKSTRGSLVGGSYGYKNTSPLGTTSINGISLSVAEAFVPKSAPVAKPQTTTKSSSPPVIASRPKVTDAPKSTISSPPVTTSKPKPSPNPVAVSKSKPPSSPSVPNNAATKKPPLQKSPTTPSSSPSNTKTVPTSKPLPKPVAQQKSSPPPSSSSEQSSSFFKLPFSKPKSPQDKTEKVKIETNIDSKRASNEKKVIAKKEAPEKAARTKKEAEEKKLAADRKKMEAQQKKEAELQLKKERELKVAADKKARVEQAKQMKLDSKKAVAAPASPVSSSLPKNLVAIIAKNKGDVAKVETAIKQFNEGKIQNEKFCKDIVDSMGNIDAAVAVLPDIIGSLPRGDRKSTLNQYFQQQL